MSEPTHPFAFQHRFEVAAQSGDMRGGHDKSRIEALLHPAHVIDCTKQQSPLV